MVSWLSLILSYYFGQTYKQNHLFSQILANMKVLQPALYRFKSASCVAKPISILPTPNTCPCHIHFTKSHAIISRSSPQAKFVFGVLIFLALGKQEEPAYLYIIATDMGKPQNNEAE